jgi:hypothetical protein
MEQFVGGCLCGIIVVLVYMKVFESKPKCGYTYTMTGDSATVTVAGPKFENGEEVCTFFNREKYLTFDLAIAVALEDISSEHYLIRSGINPEKDIRRLRIEVS